MALFGKGARRDLREGARIGLAAVTAGVRALQGERLQLRAMALTYVSLVALVPGLLVAFTVLQAFAGRDWIRSHVDDFLLENFAVGARATLQGYLEGLAKSSHAAGAGLVGAALLAFTAVNLFAGVERALNDIWAVHRRRPRAQQLTVYWAGLTVGPLILAGSLGLGYQAREWLGGSAMVARAGSLLLTCIFFAVLYFIVPATRVKALPAALGGVVAGLAWEAAKFAYAWAVAHLFRFQAVYGSLAAVLIFLVWLYVSWTIFLFGARLAFVLQHVKALVHAHRGESTPLARELLAGQVMLEVALAYDRGAPPPDPGDVAARLDMLAEPVREMVDALRQMGLVHDVAGGGLVPSRPLGQLTLGDLRRVSVGRSPEVPAETEGRLLAGLLSGAENLAQGRLAETTFEELCARLRTPSRRIPV
jgi:membrane protein